MHFTQFTAWIHQIERGWDVLALFSKLNCDESVFQTYWYKLNSFDHSAKHQYTCHGLVIKMDLVALNGTP
jgi:hypothetical protein